MKKQTIRIAGFVLGLFFVNSAQAATVRSVSVGPQSPARINPGGTATFVVSVTRIGSGNVEAYLSSLSWPSQATATFSPASVVFTGNSTTPQQTTLTVSTTTSIPAGTYTFQVVARDGQSFNAVTNTGTLVVGGDPPSVVAPPNIIGIVLLADLSVQISGTALAGQSVAVQATFDVGAPSWTTIGTTSADTNGFVSFIDADSKLYPARFYRFAITQ